MQRLTDEPFLSNLFVTMGYSVSVVSILIMTLAISVDRYLALNYHMRYGTFVTGSRVKCILGRLPLVTTDRPD